MLKNYLTYIKVWLLFQLLIEINCQVIPFSPKQRSSHTATLIDHKLYILGGDPRDTAGKDFFYLDIPTSLQNQKPFWIDLSNVNIVPPHFGAASVKGGANNNTLFLYGGVNETEMELVYTYDPTHYGWSVPNIVGLVGVNSINKKSYLTGIVDRYGKMYLWGGDDVVGTGLIGNHNVLNSMIVLDTTNFIWNTTNAPIASMHYAATLLPNQTIIYLGYYLDGVYLYDTINNKWNLQATSGDIPSLPYRIGFSVVLGLDGQRVIMYGGFDNTTDGTTGPLYVLNLADFRWYVPKTSGRIPSTRYDHKANVIDKYMVISFGNGYNQSIESDVLLLDISNNDEYIWVDDFNFIHKTSPPTSPPVETSPAKTPQAKPSSNKSIIIGAIVGSLVGILLGTGSFFLYKWNRNKSKQKKVAPTLENEEKNQGQKEIQLINVQEVLQKPEDAITKK